MFLTLYRKPVLWMQLCDSPEEGAEDSWQLVPLSGMWEEDNLGEALWVWAGLGSNLTQAGGRDSEAAQDFKSSVFMSAGPAWLGRVRIEGVWERGAFESSGTVEHTCPSLPLVWAGRSTGPLLVPQFWQGFSVQELHTLCSSELRLRDSGVFPEAVVSVLLEECKFIEPGSLMSVFSTCEESHGEDEVFLADKWRMMLHWSEITSLSHCKQMTASEASPDIQNKHLFHVMAESEFLTYLWMNIWNIIIYIIYSWSTCCCSSSLLKWLGGKASEEPEQISSPSRIPAGSIITGGFWYCDLIASGTCRKSRVWFSHSKHKQVKTIRTACSDLLSDAWPLRFSWHEYEVLFA